MNKRTSAEELRTAWHFLNQGDRGTASTHIRLALEALDRIHDKAKRATMKEKIAEASREYGRQCVIAEPHLYSAAVIDRCTR